MAPGTGKELSQNVCLEMMFVVFLDLPEWEFLETRCHWGGGWRHRRANSKSRYTGIHYFPL